jgi:hypothetical protein
VKPHRASSVRRCRPNVPTRSPTWPASQTARRRPWILRRGATWWRHCAVSRAKRRQTPQLSIGVPRPRWRGASSLWLRSSRPPCRSPGPAQCRWNGRRHRSHCRPMRQRRLRGRLHRLARSRKGLSPRQPPRRHRARRRCLGPQRRSRQPRSLRQRDRPRREPRASPPGRRWRPGHRCSRRSRYRSALPGDGRRRCPGHRPSACDLSESVSPPARKPL